METITVASTREFPVFTGYEIIFGAAVVAIVAWMVITGIKHLRGR